MKSWFRNTAGGKVGTIDGLNLFFGALLGANLGTMDAMPLADYLKTIVLLAGTVVVLRMLSTSEQRVKMLVVLGVYVAVIASMVLVPSLQPTGMAPGDFQRLVATLAVWLVLVLATEFLPSERIRKE